MGAFHLFYGGAPEGPAGSKLRAPGCRSSVRNLLGCCKGSYLSYHSMRMTSDDWVAVQEIDVNYHSMRMTSDYGAAVKDFFPEYEDDIRLLDCCYGM